jgi:hypothetical protein
VFDWLFEGRLEVYVLLATVLIGLLYGYWQWRRNGWLYAAAGAAALVGLYALLDRLVETERETIEAQVAEMAAELRGHHHDAFFSHFSDDFLSPAGHDKATFRHDVEWRMDSITEVKYWGMNWESRPERGKDFDGLRFSFKVVGAGGDFPADCRPVFEYDQAAKRWRVKKLKLYKLGTTEEYTFF